MANQLRIFVSLLLFNMDLLENTFGCPNEAVSTISTLGKLACFWWAEFDSSIFRSDALSFQLLLLSRVKIYWSPFIWKHWNWSDSIGFIEVSLKIQCCKMFINYLRIVYIGVFLRERLRLRRRHWPGNAISNLNREPILNGKVQYTWPPCTN